MVEVKIRFETEEAAGHFLVWLQESGEQHYWEWMQTSEMEEDGDITALQFNYEHEKFLVKTLLGRLDDA